MFEALDLENPELLLAKAQLSVKIPQTIEARGLDDAAAAKVMGFTRKRLTQFHARHLDDISLDELFDMLKALGQDVNITVQPAAEATAHLRVSGA